MLAAVTLRRGLEAGLYQARVDPLDCAKVEARCACWAINMVERG
jgi:hypothetical protein